MTEFPFVLTIFSEEIVKGEWVKIGVASFHEKEAATEAKDNFVREGFAVESNVELPLAAA